MYEYPRARARARARRAASGGRRAERAVWPEHRGSGGGGTDRCVDGRDADTRRHAHLSGRISSFHIDSLFPLLTLTPHWQADAVYARVCGVGVAGLNDEARRTGHGRRARRAPPARGRGSEPSSQCRPALPQPRSFSSRTCPCSTASACSACSATSLPVLHVVQHPVNRPHRGLERVPLLRAQHDALACRLELAAALVEVVLLSAAGAAEGGGGELELVAPVGPQTTGLDTPRRGG